MEVATATPTNGGVPPFHDHDVREWSTLDSLTGVLERARIETDHWAASGNNSSHKYGKVVDSRARTDADGGLRQQARRQLEVYQSQVPGGRLQVVKTHSVSSSRWTNKRVDEVNGGGSGFEGLQAPSNPLDLSFQKFKAAVGRGASRRPPSRIKNKEDTSPTRQQDRFNSTQFAAPTNLERVTRLCHQLHENAVKQGFGKYANKSSTTESSNLSKTNEIEGRRYTTNEKSKEITYSNDHTNLSRAKSSSSEDFLILSKDKSTKSTEDLEDLEHLQTWRRTSKIRRSLQNPKQDRASPSKPLDLPEASINVRRITEDFEKGRRLSTALRGNNIDLQALDQILQSISSSSSEKTSIADEDVENIKKEALKSKRNSFVTVESLQEIKGRLRRTSSPDKDLIDEVKHNDIDDGIVTEELPSKIEDNMIKSNNMNSPSRVRSYVYGMESINKKPVSGTGSLESRSKLLNGTTNRSEDWYNRRKSYGFEPVQNQNESISSKKNIVESSTDSGICRSSEVIVVPSVIKNNYSDSEECNVDYNGVMNRLSSVDLNRDTSFGKVKRISSLFDNATNKINSIGVKRDQDSNFSWNKRSTKENEWSFNPGITIKIPIVSNNHWNEEPEKDIKRHSIAVDETKYVSQNKITSEPRRTSLVINEKFLNAPVTFENNDHDFSAFNKKSKKVEFCKTEVHFAAESGKVNIVETDEKPPPTQNFRRRRRNSNSLNYLNEFNKNGLPVLHFGENYVEKTLFANGNQQYPDEGNSSEETEGNASLGSSVSHGVVTVNSDFNNIGMFDDDKRESSENESIRGILKNKIAKPIPYHLGENSAGFNIFDDDWNSQKILEKDPPVWKSTVTVRNTLFDKLRNGEDDTSILKTFDPNNQPDIIKDQLKRLKEHQTDFKRVEPSERVRPFFSVAERIKHMEESQKIDSHKGYSTRVNIGEGQAIVVENSALNSGDIYLEPSKEETKEHKQILKKGLVVRIGRDNSTTKHMVCSKTTTNQNSSNTTTTTKITIDLSPTEDEDNQSLLLNAKCNGSHSFKSTSLILNTIKSQNEPEKLNKVPCQIPQQLEALKRLYEEENSDSDADKEVQLLTSRIAERELEKIEDDNSSVVSGSWSRMRAYKNVYERANHKRTKDVSSLESTIAQIEKESKVFNQSESVRHPEEPVRIKTEIRNRKYSPIVLRKHPIVAKTAELKSANASVNLSSPLLVSKRLTSDKLELSQEKTNKTIENGSIQDKSHKKTNEKKGAESNTKNSFIKNERVLRQPKTSELAYFGVQMPAHHRSDNDYFTKEIKTSSNVTTKQPHFTNDISKKAEVNSRSNSIQNSDENSNSPIYENISPLPTKLETKSTREFDSCILDELTKAADEILQAVKDYSEEDSRKRKEEEVKTELSTITENKSWKHQEKINKPVDRPCKSRLRNASSNSSLEASPKDTKPTLRYISNTKASADKIKTKTTSSESSGLKATTKARRLQRASSREALLQSHGSSSEDLVPNEVPLRKPRLVRKTKTTQLTISNGLEISKKNTVSTNAKKKIETTAKTKAEERLPGALPEIRHKTAVSTIKSTAEKTIRDRSKHRGEEIKKKVPPYKDLSQVSASPVNSMKNKRETVTHRLATANIKKYRPERH